MSTSSTHAVPRFPFTALVNQELAKEALLLAVANPAVHGVLFLGPKGTGKTTLVRSLTTLIPDMDVVELPIGSGEDMVLGTIDAEKTLATGKTTMKRGILSRANGNLLYIDEVNLLPDHLVDVILDAAATGEFRLEREGVSAAMPSRFVLSGSMNPEEGWLRPQLLDRFGLAVHMEGLTEVEDRSEVFLRSRTFNRDPEAVVREFEPEQQRLRERVLTAREILGRVHVPDEVIQKVIRSILELGVITHRAELTTLQGAVARAALHGREEVRWEDIQVVMPLALQHRLGDTETQSQLTWEILERTLLEGRKDEEDTRRGWIPTPFFRKKKPANPTANPPSSPGSRQTGAGAHAFAQAFSRNEARKTRHVENAPGTA